jgi:hypothetical protein
VRKEFSPSRLALRALCVLSLFGLGACGQVGAPGQQSALEQQSATGQQQAQPTEHANGMVQDWSNHNLVYPRFGPIETMIALQHDPRAVQSWQAAARADWRRYNNFRLPNRTHTSLRVDWSIGLGIGGMAPAMFPAKFTFDPTAAPTCRVVGSTNPDFIVYSVNVAGGAAQPNIVAFQDLYSGTAPGPTGICNTQRPTYFTGDTITSAATFWSYNIKAADGVVSTSPALSLDGTKVAFVEKGAGTQAHFHVLAWNGGTSLVAGDGVNTANSQLVTSPKSITSGFAILAPAAGSGTVTDLALGSASDTLSSPFVDLTNDLAYVGNDAGVLFRIKHVFCTAITGCTVGVTAAPSLDSTWGTLGALTIGGTCTGVLGKLTGPVVDSKTGNVFVGCADGKLYGFTSTGTAITGSPLSVGDASAFGGIVDPPMVDPVNGFVYVGSGSSGGSAVLVQASTSNFSSPTPPVATLGAGGHFNLHAPSFNDAYFSSGTSTNWLIYDWALNAGDTAITLYGTTFAVGHNMNSGVPANAFTVPGSSPVELSPTTEFLNGVTDQLFVSGLAVLSPNFLENHINTFPVGITASATEGSGTTGIVVDNSSGSAQASSVYFGVLTSNTAVKLTQSGLQ